VAGFKTIIKYLDVQYPQARNYKTATGTYTSFSASVGGKTCPIYWHLRLKAAGNSDLSICAYSTLNNSIHRTSTEMAKAWQRKSHSAALAASECSLSLISDFDSVHNRKHAAVEATEDAAYCR